MSPEQLTSAMAVLRDAGIIGLLGFALIGGFRGWYVWRWTYERDMASKDATIARLLVENTKWETRAMRLLKVSDTLAEKVSGL
jgi:hypothetical protein